MCVSAIEYEHKVAVIPYKPSTTDKKNIEIRIVDFSFITVGSNQTV